VRLRLLLLALGCTLSAALALAAAPSAQGADGLAPPLPDTTAERYTSSVALLLMLTEDGIGVGGASRVGLSPDLSFTAEITAGAARDEREQQFFVGFFGDTVTPFKRNYAVIVPLHVGLERRLLRRQIEDNFRPFVSAAAGPSFAAQWPYFDDLNENGLRDAGEDRLGTVRGLGRAEARFGVGGSLAVGAAFGRNRRALQALRFGFTGHYFPTPVDLLELEAAIEQPSRRLFLTPVVTVHIGRFGG
jgi:hypothetical protein